MKYILSVLISLFAMALSAQDVVVTKTARRSNPTLAISKWSGDKALLAQIRSDLKISDWFNIVDGKADYVVTGSTKGGADGALTATISLTSAQGNAVTFSRTMQNVDWLAHVLVDDLILKAFKNPGFCSTRLSYVRNDGKSKELVISQFDGAKGLLVTKNGTISTEPDWSSDNKYVSYTLYNRTQTQVVLHDVQQKRWRFIAKYEGLNSGCSLANKSMTAALTLSKDGQVDLYVKNALGGNPKRLTSDRFAEASPTWSPDDKTICYVGSQSRKPTLFTIPAKGGQATRVLNQLVEAVSPDWSPVSNRICFAMRKGSNYTIAYVDMSSTEKTPIIPIAIAGDWEAPSWTADGRHLVCSRKYRGSTSLYLVDTWYGRARELVKCGVGTSLPACSGSIVTRK